MVVPQAKILKITLYILENFWKNFYAGAAGENFENLLLYFWKIFEKDFQVGAAGENFEN